MKFPSVVARENASAIKAENVSINGHSSVVQHFSSLATIGPLKAVAYGRTHDIIGFNFFLMSLFHRMSHTMKSHW